MATKVSIIRLEPHKMRKATTGLDNGGLFIKKSKHSWAKKNEYSIGNVTHGSRPNSINTSTQVVSKEFYDAFVKEAKKHWKDHKEVVTNDEIFEEKTEY